MDRHWRWKKKLLSCLLLYINVVSAFQYSGFGASGEGSGENLGEGTTRRSVVLFRRARRVRRDDLLRLNKVLRSVTEDENPGIDNIESALQSIDKDHEHWKRNKITKALAILEEHTKKALRAPKGIAVQRLPGKAHLWPQPMASQRKGGRTVTISTYSGRKRVFIPKGWIFCTISPARCYSSRAEKGAARKRSTNKRAVKR
ncbi:uncharacterized protein LOC116604401 [Nematostella vectensis]|uniref:uncharacterized protein LOC116604401 n=1 Tax=Nematostella vectensis TaxID=45351 RepID=UPI00138FBD4D|nr:uncharacterized protein LOC116604401 [Nematostella vectensis]